MNRVIGKVTKTFKIKVTKVFKDVLGVLKNNEKRRVVVNCFYIDFEVIKKAEPLFEVWALSVNTKI